MFQPNRMTEEEKLWAKGELEAELDKIQDQINDVESKVKSALKQVTDIHKSLLEKGFMSEKFATCEEVLNDLSKTITSLTAFQEQLQKERINLIDTALAIDPLFLCTR